jgi:transcription elongation factor GreA
MVETKYLTREGYEKLKEELKYLREVKRLEIAEHIRIAKEDGDLTENAGYDAAKYEQSMVEGRILTLEAILNSAQIIRDDGQTDVVTVGNRVTVQEDGYDPETYHVVGSTEADPSRGRISNESPLGQAILGRAVGDTVQVSTPGGVTSFAILEIA